jgi:hypothetical protein
MVAAGISMATAAGCTPKGDIISTGAKPGGSTVIVSPSAALTVPDGFGPIRSLVADEDGSGVWFIDNSSTELDLFHATGSGLNTYPLATSTSVVDSGNSSIAVSADGSTVWAGADSTLFELDVANGTVTSWTIPSPSVNVGQRPLLPPGDQGNFSVSGIAASPDGSQIAISTIDSSSVDTFSTASDTFGSLSMPGSSDLPLSLLYLPDGNLIVGFSDISSQAGQADDLEVFAPTGSSETVMLPVPGSAWNLSPSGSELIVGSTDLAQVAFASSTTSSPGPASVTDLSLPTPLVGSSSANTPLASVSGQSDLGRAASGLEEFTDQEGSSQPASAEMLTQAPVSCGLDGSDSGLLGPAKEQTTETTGGVCPSPVPTVYTTDGAGTVWVVSPNDPESLLTWVPRSG